MSQYRDRDDQCAAVTGRAGLSECRRASVAPNSEAEVQAQLCTHPATTNGVVTLRLSESDPTTVTVTRTRDSPGQDSSRKLGSESAPGPGRGDRAATAAAPKHWHIGTRPRGRPGVWPGRRPGGRITDHHDHHPSQSR